MRVAVIGGKLQGVEAVYLAKKAGWEVVLVDKEYEVLAAELCDQFYCLDVIQVPEWIQILKGIELIIPALENQEALDSLIRSANAAGVPLVFDGDAYEISSSKISSNLLFAETGIPRPIPWPECGFPIIVKPSNASGSEGVLKIINALEYQSLLAEKDLSDWVIEEYMEGPSYSIEVIGFSGVYKVLQITELHMDGRYDCKRVMGSSSLSDEYKEQFKQIGLSLASSLKLNGIMDIETILHQGQLKVLEIDARLPSQTPIAVYHATGINMLEILGEAFVNGKPWKAFNVLEKRGVIYEHIHVQEGHLEVTGEHIMAGVSPLHYYRDFYGADEALTSYLPGKSEWVATLIITGDDCQGAWIKRCIVLQKIRKECAIRHYNDLYPVVEDSDEFIKIASGS